MLCWDERNGDREKKQRRERTFRSGSNTNASDVWCWFTVKMSNQKNVLDRSSLGQESIMACASPPRQCADFGTKNVCRQAANNGLF
jgi:hypothetical protein